MSEEILASARQLGDALSETPEVKAFLQAEEAFRSSQDVQRLEAQVNQTYLDLVERQRRGEMVHPHEVHEFYRQRDELIQHPLVIERENCLNSVKALFEQAGRVLNSILSVDYTQLADHAVHEHTEQ